MGASFAPNLTNPVLLIFLLMRNIQKCIKIKLIIREIDDTMMICEAQDRESIIKLFSKFHPKILDFTVTHMDENKGFKSIKFLDILFIN